MTEKPLQVVKLQFAVLDFYEQFVVSRPKEDEIIGLEQLKDLIAACAGFYKEKKFIYLSQRVNNYNVNPTIYLHLGAVKNLAGIAVVSQRTSSLNMAQFEKNFSKLPYQIFLELDEAFKWSKGILKK